ncbi:MAG: cupin domain-containing protein, partial [Leucobacter sp.]
FDDPALEWADYPHALPGDSTPEGTGPGEFAVVFESGDKRIKIGAWTREVDYGDIAGSGQCIDVVVEGEVTLVDKDGRRMTAGAGDLLIYNGEDTGEWIQDGPIKKFYIQIQDK